MPNVRVHDVLVAVVLCTLGIGGMIGQRLFSHYPWIGAIVGGYRLLIFLVVTVGAISLLDWRLRSTKAYRESFFMRELGRHGKSAHDGGSI